MGHRGFLMWRSFGRHGELRMTKTFLHTKRGGGVGVRSFSGFFTAALRCGGSAFVQNDSLWVG